MSRNVEDYQKLLLSLLPKSRILKFDLVSEFGKLMKGLGYSLARIEDDALLLLEEKFINTCDDLLSNHEKDFNLPDNGFNIGSTTDQRKEELYFNLQKVGNQNNQYFIDLAAEIGYNITITECIPAWSGVANAGSGCNDQKNIFFWFIDIDATTIMESYQVNLSKLIYKIDSVKPGHTHTLYRFVNVSFDQGFSRAFSRIPYYDNSFLELDFDANFSNAFANNWYYDGVNLTGSFGQAFSIDYDRMSGGNFEFLEFDSSFSKPA